MCPNSKISSQYKYLFIAVFLSVVVTQVPFVAADSSDHIGPDPIQSDHCITITPGRSVTCAGQQLTPQSDTVPMVTISCGPGIFMLINHRQIPTTSSVREVRLISEEGEYTDQWLAISDTQSALLVFYLGAQSRGYQWMIRLVGQLITPELSLFGYSFDKEGVEGLFELNYSDRKQIERMASSCG